MNTWYIIINKTSGKGISFKKLAKLKIAFQKLNDAFKIVYTNYANHELVLIEKATKMGFNKFISVGGDGTLHHIVNGLMIQKNIELEKIIIAVIPLGTGNDWSKQYNYPKKMDQIVAVVNKNKTTNQDIGKIELNNKTTYFNNSAGIGFDGFVVSKINKKYGKLSYLIAALKSIFLYKKSKIIFKFNQSKINTKTLLTTIGLCRFSGGNMQLTHKPNPNDGFFDIAIIKDISFLELLLNIKKIYNGKLNMHKEVICFKTAKINVQVISKQKAFIQADGELLGQGDFRVKIVKNALNFVIN